MCGRFILTSPLDAIRAVFAVEATANIPARYNIAPKQPVLVVRHDEKGIPELVAVEWGFVPEWIKEPAKEPVINARIETVAAKPYFRASIKRKRCLVPMNGWYEWKTEGGRKQPYLIAPADGSLMAFAGVWSTWHGPQGEHWLETMAILTAPATGPLSTIHHRRPMVVAHADHEAWLTTHDPLPRRFLEDFPFVGERAFDVRPVSTRVGNVRFDSPECLDPPEHERQASLF